MVDHRRNTITFPKGEMILPESLAETVIHALRVAAERFDADAQEAA